MLPPKIAVIHNDVAVANLLVVFLEEVGYFPAAYGHHDPVMGRLRHSPPDLAIIDLELVSAHGGGALVDLMRADPLTRHIPIIALTTSPDPEAVRPASCTHNCEMLPEPFDLNSIQGLIRSLLKSPQRSRCG